MYSQAPSFPCEEDARFAEFDFWVGSWDVHVADGSLAGENEITRAERGCVLIERWRSARGGTGRMNSTIGSNQPRNQLERPMA